MYDHRVFGFDEFGLKFIGIGKGYLRNLRVKQPKKIIITNPRPVALFTHNKVDKLLISTNPIIYNLVLFSLLGLLF